MNSIRLEVIESVRITIDILNESYEAEVDEYFNYIEEKHIITISNIKILQKELLLFVMMKYNPE